MHDTRTADESARLHLHDRCTGSQGSLTRHRHSQVSHASKSIINPIMREILMRCALKSDSGVIIRVVLPVVESWSWTEACSVAESERKCCYACRSCSHLCLNQWLYIICFFLQREAHSPLCSQLNISIRQFGLGQKHEERSDDLCFSFRRTWKHRLAEKTQTNMSDAIIDYFSYQDL